MDRHAIGSGVGYALVRNSCSQPAHVLWLASGPDPFSARAMTPAVTFEEYRGATALRGIAFGVTVVIAGRCGYANATLTHMELRLPPEDQPCLA